ncbi:MAG TPA: abortive infection family protein, partial [Bryobacteraceae bacterium]|nr:abortive infection family protein [Bryobacteraceae bacterium]
AIDDAEALLRTTGAVSGVDRMHTAFHGFLRALCDQVGIACAADASITALYKTIREKHPGLRDLGAHSEHVDRIVKSFASAVDSLNTLRNHASIAHPNAVLLDREEAYLYVNAVRTLMAYIDAKVIDAQTVGEATRGPCT